MTHSFLRASVIQGFFTGEHPLSSTTPSLRGGEGKLGSRRPPSYQELTLQAHQRSSRLAVQPLGNRNAFVIPSRLATFGRRSGQKLPPAVQQKMESFFRADFYMGGCAAQVCL